jgi:hypothetical protein
MILTLKKINYYKDSLMNSLSIKQLLVLLLIFFMCINICNAQPSGKRGPRNPEKSLFGSKLRKQKAVNVREPKKVRNAKEKQAKNKAKLRKEYYNFVDESRKHNFKIQTPEVKARMKQNAKDITAREKDRKKRTLASTRKGASKYK